MLLLITPCKMKNDLFCPFFFSPLFDCVYIDITVYFLWFATKLPFLYIKKRIYHSIYSIKLSCFFILRNQTGFLACVKFLNFRCVYKLTGWQSSTLPASNSDAILFYSHIFWISPSVCLPHLIPLFHFQFQGSKCLDIICTHTHT